MHLLTADIRHVKGLTEVGLDFGSGPYPGWHVILGDNGSGKTTLIRALALAFVGHGEAMALQEDWTRWVESGHPEGGVEVEVLRDPRFDKPGVQGRPVPNTTYKAHLTVRSVLPSGLPRNTNVPRRGEIAGTATKNSLWGNGAGWFSASFGPSRRFTGGSGGYQRIFFSNPRVARHLSAFSEEVALSESLAWLVDKHRAGDRVFVERIKRFVNHSVLLPHEVSLDEVDDQGLRFSDGNGVSVAVGELSDGYRSILSLALELLRQMELTYGLDLLFTCPGEPAQTPLFGGNSDRVYAPGVVLIDEVDAHLHPSWQATVGDWFTARFPNVQFIVATHSPLVCRSIGETGRVFHLREPGADGPQLVEITGENRDKLWYGSLHRSLESPGFGLHLGRSPYGRERLRELGALNRIALDRELSPHEEERRSHLRAVLSDSLTPGDEGR